MAAGNTSGYARKNLKYAKTSSATTATTVNAVDQGFFLAGPDVAEGEPDTAPAARLMLPRSESSPPPPAASLVELRDVFFLFFLRLFLDTGMGHRQCMQFDRT